MHVLSPQIYRPKPRLRVDIVDEQHVLVISRDSSEVWRHVLAISRDSSEAISRGSSEQRLLLNSRTVSLAGGQTDDSAG